MATFYARLWMADDELGGSIEPNGERISKQEAEASAGLLLADMRIAWPKPVIPGQTGIVTGPLAEERSGFISHITSSQQEEYWHPEVEYVDVYFSREKLNSAIKTMIVEYVAAKEMGFTYSDEDSLLLKDFGDVVNLRLNAYSYIETSSLRIWADGFFGEAESSFWTNFRKCRETL